jgi:nicotinamide mononucleotide transporter PnuC
MRNPFVELNKKDWVIYSISLIVVTASNFVPSSVNYFNLISTLLGVTALIFIAKGNLWGQIIMVIFCTMYAITAWGYRYYGEVLTYLGMSLPIAVIAVFSWAKNPYEKGRDVVKIRKFTITEGLVALVFSAIVTLGFHFILKAFNTPNLVVSTISVTTSFLAAYLMFRRISFYAVAYAVNDVVLIVLWVLASIENLVYLSMVACFLVFLLNDLYGFINWRIREREQCFK